VFHLFLGWYIYTYYNSLWYLAPLSVWNYDIL
jgi:hypothetical protein